MSLTTIPSLPEDGFYNYRPTGLELVTESEVSALNAAVTAADDASIAAKTRRAEAEAKRDALQARLDALPSAPPESDNDEATSLIEALAADPAHIPAEGHLAAVTAQRVASRRAWETQVAEGDILRHAVRKVEQEIGEIGEEIERLASDRARHWKALLAAAQPFLLDRFSTAFAALVADTLQIAGDLQRLTIEGRQLVPPHMWRIGGDSMIALVRSVRTETAMNQSAPMIGSHQQVHKLFEMERGELREPSEAIMRFRDSLG